MGVFADSSRNGTAGPRMQRMERTVGYASNSGVQIAYEVLGSGERDFVLVLEWATSLDVVAEHESTAFFQNRLAELGRVIRFDLRGTGLSERVDQMPPLEEWVDDLRAVLAAVDSEPAILVGHGHAAQLCMLFAAMYPDRTEALIIVNGFARLSRAPDYAFGYPPNARARMLESVRASWGTGQTTAFTAPTFAAKPGGLEFLARSERASCTPNRAAKTLASVFAVDVRDILPSISAPTLVLHGASDPFVSPEHGQYLAEHIHGARYVERPSIDHAFFATDDSDPWMGPIEEFLDAPKRVAPPTRSLMTIAFTDIVDSTQTASELGDAEWRRLLERHQALARQYVERASGRVVKFTGDGMMATFDGPARAIECLRDLGNRLDDVGLPIRSGVHTGEVELLGDDIGGIGVHIAARVASKASAREIFVSSTVRDLVAGSGLEFTDQGPQELKGVPGTWQLLSVK